MASPFFRRLLGTPAPAPPEVAEAVAQLGELARTRPALGAPAAVLREALPTLFAPPARIPILSIAPEAAAVKRAGGVPLLRGETLTLDPLDLRGRVRAMCEAVARHQGGPPARAAYDGTLDLVGLLHEVLAGRPEAVPTRAEASGLDPALTATALRLAALPLLAPVAAALAPAGWDRGHCPTCGSWPLLAELRGLDQARVLRCGLCAAGWEFPRLACPFCATQDHRRLGYLHAEGEQDRYRAATCDNCRGYIKTASTLAALPAPLLLVQDLATLHLDLIAADRGFFVP